MAPRQHPITSDAIAFWRFNTATGDIPDLTGNGHTAVEFGTVPAQTGQFGVARGEFTQSNYFVVPDSLSLRPTTFTFCGWVYWATTAQRQFSKVMGKDQNLFAFRGGSYQFQITSQELDARLSYGDGAPGVTADLSASPTVGWHHIGMTYDDSSRILSAYYDGVLTETAQMPEGESIFYDSTGIWFGRDATAVLSEFFRGWIEEVVLYSIVQPEWWFCWIAGGNDCFPPEICGKDLINKADGYTLTHYECLPDQHRNVNNGGGVLSAPFSLGNRFMHIRRR
jgi:hypothetical protein